MTIAEGVVAETGTEVDMVTVIGIVAAGEEEEAAMETEEEDVPR